MSEEIMRLESIIDALYNLSNIVTDIRTLTIVLIVCVLAFFVYEFLTDIWR